MHAHRTHSKRRRAAALLGLGVLTLGVSGIAYAYWTTSGSGSGTAATGTVVAVVVKQTSTVTGLAPGGAAQTLSGNFDNPNAGPVYVATVTVSSVTTDKTGCTSADHTIVQPSAVNAEIPAGTAKGSWGGGSIQFNNTASSQDACKGAAVTLAYAAS